MNKEIIELKNTIEMLELKEEDSNAIIANLRWQVTALKNTLTGLLDVSRECANDYVYGEKGYEFYRAEALKLVYPEEA
jgi:hypothetical protein